MHFGYDPGADYDWSRFPEITTTQRPNEISSSATSVNTSRRSNQQSENSQLAASTSLPIIVNGDTIELSRDERMCLIQKYLDIVKLELFDPGPASVKRLAHLATNSSGMRVNIVNIQVTQPSAASYQSTTTNPVQGSNKNESGKTSKSIRQKFLNIFKKVRKIKMKK